MRVSRRRRATLVALAALSTGVALVATGPARGAPLPLDRPADPVEVSAGRLGAHVLGVAPQRLVAFRWDGSWTQVPVQVDERVYVDWGTVRHSTSEDLTSESDTLYVDDLTGTGIPDDDPAIDANDQVVFMARDAGSSHAQVPPGVVPGSGVRVKVTDPLDGSVGYVYLYTATAGDPVQPSTNVAYDFDLDASREPYATKYGFGGPRPGPNPENSLVTTPSYRTHFVDRWVRDRLRVGSSPDLIDREKVLFIPDVCNRTVTTASYAGGAFIANKVGPVRAIRSYVAFNSGLITQRDHFFYDQREDETTYLRVHPVPGAMTFLDFAAAAIGMTYTGQPEGTGPVFSDQIDGVPAQQSLELPALRWDMVSGTSQGTIVRSSRTSIAKVKPAGEPPLPGEGVAVRSYYEDNSQNPTDRCNDEAGLPDDDADGDALGSSGTWAQPEPPPGGPTDLLPCTDPLRDADHPPGPVCERRWDLSVTTHFGFVAPGLPVSRAAAQQISDRATTPVRVAVAQLP